MTLVRGAKPLDSSNPRRADEAPNNPRVWLSTARQGRKEKKKEKDRKKRRGGAGGGAGGGVKEDSAQNKKC